MVKAALLSWSHVRWAVYAVWLGLCPAHLLAAPLEAARDFELERYLGTWYEVASVPSFFTRGCVATTATYARKPDGEVSIFNACHKGSLDGEVSSISGRAWVPDPALPSQLKISFFWPMKADYWVLAVGPAYRWAVVGEPDRESLWILSRTRQLPDADFQEALARARVLEYDVTRLKRTLQPPSP